MTTLARWRAAQLEDGKPEKKRRPFDPNECTDLADAERFRLGIIREISKKVTQIQNAGLGEFKIRDLNDHINRLLRDKRNWEGRIKQLGGVDFKIQSSRWNRRWPGRTESGCRGTRGARISWIQVLWCCQRSTRSSRTVRPEREIHPKEDTC